MQNFFSKINQINQIVPPPSKKKGWEKFGVMWGIVKLGFPMEVSPYGQLRELQFIILIVMYVSIKTYWKLIYKRIRRFSVQPSFKPIFL